jgi:CSLREA domain-containing protein
VVSPGTSSHRSTAARISVLAALALAFAVPAANANTIAVDTTHDGFGASGRCGLRDAIQAAQTDAASGGCAAGSGADVVALSAGRYDLTLSGGGEDANQA